VRLTVLGTAAAEGWPALWCTCEACREAARRGGPDIRMRAAYSIDGHIQIDLGPDALAQMWRFGIDYARMDHLFITHAHEDHLLASNILFRQPGFARMPEESLLTVHGNDLVRQALEHGHTVLPLARSQFEVIEPFRPVDVGDVRVTPVRADHGGPEAAVTYLVESGGRAILQGNDTGWYPDDTWQFLAGREIDAVLLDCTYGLKSGGASHLGAPEVVEAKAELLSLGALATDGRMIATHLSHNGGALHQELCEFFAPHGIEVAYDGMVIEV
jgi:phosphoribosyl 1,2-cyclic phosphate phosphodiesterase